MVRDWIKQPTLVSSETFLTYWSCMTESFRKDACLLPPKCSTGWTQRSFDSDLDKVICRLIQRNLSLNLEIHQPLTMFLLKGHML